jgi:hypothetical protein
MGTNSTIPNKIPFQMGTNSDTPEISSTICLILFVNENRYV